MDRMYIADVIFKGELSKRSYLNEIPAVKYLIENERISFTKNVTFFVGENGSGKSTLLEAIAVASGFNAEGGTKNFSFSSRDTHSELYEHITISRERFAKDGFFLRAESLYNAASYIDESDEAKTPAEFFLSGPPIIDSYGGISLHKQSHGESFIAIVKNRFGGKGLYILDEPEAALSPMRLMELLVYIDKNVKDDSQFIIATHSPILMAYPDAEILEFSQEGIKSVDYKQTEHFKITKRFIENPEKMLRYLLENEE